MKREDFKKVTKEHVENCKKIIELESCDSIECSSCPFYPRNYGATPYCETSKEMFVEFIDMYNKYIRKQRKCYSITDLLRRQVRELQKETGITIVDSKKLKYLKEEECRDIIKELYRKDFYKTDSWLVRLARKIGGQYGI